MGVRPGPVSVVYTGDDGRAIRWRLGNWRLQSLFASRCLAIRVPTCAGNRENFPETFLKFTIRQPFINRTGISSHHEGILRVIPSSHREGILWVTPSKESSGSHHWRNPLGRTTGGILRVAPLEESSRSHHWKNPPDCTTRGILQVSTTRGILQVRLLEDSSGGATYPEVSSMLRPTQRFLPGVQPTRRFSPVMQPIEV